MTTYLKILYSILFLKGRVGSDIKELSSILKMKQKDTKVLIEKLEKILIKDKIWVSKLYFLGAS